MQSSYNSSYNNNVLIGVELIPLVEYKPKTRRQNCGAKRFYQANLSSDLTYEEKYLVYLIQQLGWTYEAIAQRVGCKRQFIHKQYKRIAAKTA